MTFLFSLFSSIDGFLRNLMPPWCALALWGLLGGAAVMGLYALLSPQERIRAKKKDIKAVQAELKDDSLDFASTMRLSRRNLWRSLELLGLVIGPSLISMLPALGMILFVSMLYSYQAPGPGDDLRVKMIPFSRDLRVQSGGVVVSTGNDQFVAVMGQEPVIRVYESGRAIYEWTPGMLMQDSVGKVRPWWDFIVPEGRAYLPDDSVTEEIRIGFRQLMLIPRAPRYIGGWEFVYLLALTVSAVFVKVRYRIH